MTRATSLVLVFCGAAWAQSPVATVQISRVPQQGSVNKDYVGLSIQQSVALSYFGTTNYANNVLIQLLKNIGTGTLRIGGAAADYSCWNGEPAPNPSLCQYYLSSSDFDSWANASAKSGWPLILGVNLVQNAWPGAPQYIEDEITMGIQPALQNHHNAVLTAIEPGNELNLYKLNPSYRPPTYSVPDQANDLLSYINVFRANSATKTITVAAPAYFMTSPTTVTQSLDPLVADVNTCSTCSTTNLGLVTLHEYPLSIANGNTITIGQLLSPTLDSGTEQIFNKAVTDMRNLYGLRMQIDETNSAQPDPGQPGVCDVQASALWALDYMLDMARLGTLRINLHIHDGSYYVPIAVTASGNGVYSNEVRPEYYAMYAIGPSKGLNFLPTTITSTANIRAYALSSCSTCATTVYIINKDLSASGQVTIKLSTPAHSATYLELSAPSLSSYASDVTYGGVQFDNTTGLLTGTPRTTTVQPNADGSYTVILDFASAGILTIQP